MVKKQAIGRAIGKIILMGEHSVVYGQPAIAIPFPSAVIETEIYEEKGPAILNTSSYRGVLIDAPENFEGLKSLIKIIVEDFDIALKDFTIDISTTIPIERGMGSSAAVAAATVRALYKYFSRKLDKERLTELVDYSETIVHGNASGIDTAIVVGEKPLYYIKERALEVFDFKMDGFLIVADTGQKGMTKFAVSKVRDFVELNPDRGKEIINSLGNLVKQAKKIIIANNKNDLGKLMNKAQALLKEIGVSNKAIENLVKVSLDKGALGAKLTGGGLGGSVISLCSSEEDAEIICRALVKNGAEKTWILSLGDDLNEG